MSEQDYVISTTRALTLAVQTRVYTDGRKRARVVLDESLGDTYPLTGEYPSDREAVAALADALERLTGHGPAE